MTTRLATVIAKALALALLAVAALAACESGDTGAFIEAAGAPGVTLVD